MFRVTSRQRLVSWDNFGITSLSTEDNESDYASCVDESGAPTSMSRHNSLHFLTPRGGRSCENFTELMDAQETCDDEAFVGNRYSWFSTVDEVPHLWCASKSTTDCTSHTPILLPSVNGKKRDRTNISEADSTMRPSHVTLSSCFDSADVQSNRVVRSGSSDSMDNESALHDVLPFTNDCSPNDVGTHGGDQREMCLMRGNYCIPQDWDEVRFDDIPEDALSIVFSFLHAPDLRNASLTNKGNRAIALHPFVWEVVCAHQWPLLQRLMIDRVPYRFSGASDTPTVPLLDRQHPVAAAYSYLSDANATSPSLNMSVLHAMTHAHPSCIDPIFFQPTAYLRYRSRPSEFQEFTMTATLKSDTISRERKVIQFVGPVGRGDRCVRSDFPFPSVEVPNSKRWCPGTIFQLLCRSGRTAGFSNLHPFSAHANGGFSLTTAVGNGAGPAVEIDGIRHALNNSDAGVLRQLAVARSDTREVACLRKWNSFGIATLKPFVSPFVARKVDVVELNVAPRLFAYFEISVLERDKSQEPSSSEGENDVRVGGIRHLSNILRDLEDAGSSETDCVAVGLSTAAFALRGKMPGWDAASYGYHGDDGGIFHSNGEMIRPFGPLFGVGDTVGCGINYAARGIFFTLNGEFLNYAWTDIDLSQRLFPTVGVDSQSPIEFNFGDRPWMFDVSPFAEQHRELVESAFDGFPLVGPAWR